MPEFLSPGVYIEEAPSGPRVTEGVSTSSMGVVGFTKEGPVDEATLVTSFGAFTAKFGGFTADSFVPLTVAAFFANGGARAFVVRTVAADAESALAAVSNPFVGVSMGTGDAIEVTFTLAPHSNVPVRKGSVVVTAGAVTGTDDGAGAITGAGIAAGTVDYATGAVSVTFSVAPGIGVAVIVDYLQELWGLEASSKGVWGNDLRVAVRNNEDAVDYDNGKYTRHDFLVFKKDEFGVYQQVETHESLSFTDSTDARYFPAVVNGSSSYVEVLTPGIDEVPSVLDGVAWTGVVIGVGTGAAITLTPTLANVPVFKKTVKVYCNGVLVASDNGQGRFTGSGIDPTGANTVNYTTGAVDLKLLGAATPIGEDITVDYFEAPPVSVNFDFSGGSDGVAGVTRDEVSSPTLEVSRRGMYALDRPDEIMQLCLPDFAGNVTVAGDQIAYAEARKDKFVILTTPAGLSPQEAVDYIRFQLVPNTQYAALYYPWVTVTDPLTDRPTDIPPLGHVAGVYARTDANQNVGKSPGGTADGRLNFQVGLALVMDKGERNTVYPARINPLISSEETGVAVWGVRTLSLDSAFKYINARRLLMFLEKSLGKSTQWIVFENNGADLWARISLQVTSFMLNLFGNRYFAPTATSASDAFFVQVDERNNPPEVVDAGQVLVDIGVAPGKPAEFVRLRFSQITATA